MHSPPDGNRRLDSWKAIAEYLGRDIGTVRRWEKTQGLPVRRVPGGPGRSVFAFTGEIDGWLRDADLRNGSGGQAPTAVTKLSATVWKWAAAAVLVMAVTAAVVFPLRSRASGGQVTLQITELGVAAFDLMGAERWRYTFPTEYRTFPGEVGRQWVAFPGVRPAAYAVTSHRQMRDQRVLGGELMAFDDAGGVLRRFSFDDEHRLRGTAFGAPWVVTTLAAEPAGRVAVAGHHYLWEPSVVTVLDRDFKRTPATFVHAGWIEALAWIGRDRLLIGGFQQARNGGMIGLLDPSAMNGQGPEEPGSPFYCEDCGRDRPLKLVVMPRSELNVVTGARFNRALIEVLPDRLIARTVEVPEESPSQGASDAIYEFSYDLELLGATYGGKYWDKHRALEASGKLRHTQEQCPERFGPRQIHVWDRASGWQTKALHPIQ